MDCPNCHEPVDNGAAFCGNCGQALAPDRLLSATTTTNASQFSSDEVTSDATAHTAQLQDSQALLQGIGNSLVTATVSKQPIPLYAQPQIGRQKDHFRAALSVVFGVIGVASSFVMPFVGLILATMGVISGTMSRRYLKKGLGLAGIFISSAAILVSMGTWAYAVSNTNKTALANKQAAKQTDTSQALVADEVSTPCYQVKFVSRLNVQNATGSCNLNAFDGSTLDVSHSAYKVFATQSAVSPTAFMNLAKSALERDIAQSMPDYTVTNGFSTTFSGSPAYIVQATNKQGVSLLEAAILHSGSATNNFYVIVHATINGTANLHDLELGWQWR